MKKYNFTFSIELFTCHLSSSAKRKTRFSRKCFLKKCTSFEEQNGIGHIWENVCFFIIVFSSLSSTKPCLEFISVCFSQDTKGYYQISWGNGDDFMEMMYIFLEISTQAWNFIKLRHGSVDERSMITTTLISSCHWKILVSFCLEKKRFENAFLKPTVNCCKVIQKNNFCDPTTVNWLFNDIWWFLVVGCFG